MSKASTTSLPKNPAPLPAKSAWSRGPPQSTTTPSSRSQSPAPQNQFHQTHSRRSSTLGQAVPVKDGVSVSRGNVGAFKQGESYGIDISIPSFNLMAFISGQAVTFGSIENTSTSIPSSTTTASVVKPPEGVKSFGTVAVNIPSGHVNGKASISSRSSVVTSGASSTTVSSTTGSTASLSTVATPAPSDPTSSKVNLDVRKLFQNPQGTTNSSSSDTSSPAARNMNLTQPSSHQSQPHPPSQLGPHQYPYPPNSIRQSQHSGSNGTPRSPSFSRPMANGTGPRPQGGQTGGPPATGLPSPRLGPHALNNQTSGLPPPQMAMPPTMPMWGPQTYYVSAYFILFASILYFALSIRTTNIMCIGTQLCPCKRIPNTNLPHKDNTCLITPLCPCLLGILPQIFNLQLQHYRIPSLPPFTPQFHPHLSHISPLHSVDWHHPHQHRLQQRKPLMPLHRRLYPGKQSRFR